MFSVTSAKSVFIFRGSFELDSVGATLRSVSFVGSVSGGLAGRGCERKGPGRKAGEDRHEVSYPPEADLHKASSAAG